MKRTFSPATMREIAAAFYGARVPDSTWQRWKQWAKNLGTTGSYEYLVALVAIALIRRGEHERGLNRFPELKLSAIRAICDNLELHEQIAGLIELIDQELVAGKDAAIGLQAKYGIRTSTRTLYRKIPKFHIQKHYRLDYLKYFF